MKAQAVIDPLSHRRTGFDPTPVHDRFMADKVIMIEAFLEVLPFSPVKIIPPALRIYLQLYDAINRRNNAQCLAPSKT